MGEPIETNADPPIRVPATDALGIPIDPPNVNEQPPEFVTFYDSATGDEIFHSRYVPMPANEGRQITMDMYVDGNRIHQMYYIDRIVAEENAVYLTLNKVYLNDNPIIPIS